MQIDKTAVIHPDAQLAEDVKVGPYAIIGKEVKIGAGSEIGASAIIEGKTTIGKNCRIFSHAVLGGEPQMIKYEGQGSGVIIGDNNIIREFVTIHRASKEGMFTVIGNNCFLMAYTHIAHDCNLGNEVIITSYTGLPGHIRIEDCVIISGYVGIHQFVRIGKMAMISALSRIPMDVPPYFLVEGNPAEVKGLNVVGLRRRGVSAEVRDELKKAYKLIYHSDLNTSQALAKIKEELKPFDEIKHIIGFIEASERGILK